MTSTSRTQPSLVGLEHHAPEPGVDGQPGQATADRSVSAAVPVVAVAPQLDSSRATPSAMAWRSGGSTNGNALDVAEAERRHLQDDRRQVGAQDLGLGERGPGVEVLLVVEADADAGRHAAAATRPLVGRRLRDRLDGQALHLGAAAVAGDAGRAGVDDVADAGHGERRLGHVGGEHDAPAAVGLEHAVLLGGRQPGVERQDLGVGQVRVGAGRRRCRGSRARR